MDINDMNNKTTLGRLVTIGATPEGRLEPTEIECFYFKDEFLVFQMTYGLSKVPLHRFGSMSRAEIFQHVTFEINEELTRHMLQTDVMLAEMPEEARFHVTYNPRCSFLVKKNKKENTWEIKTPWKHTASFGELDTYENPIVNDWVFPQKGSVFPVNLEAKKHFLKFDLLGNPLEKENK